jgi:hypothetical protein
MPTTYSCPIIDCTWQHRDNGPQPLGFDPTPDDVNAQAVLHAATVEHAVRAHYESHDAEEWVTLVAKLKHELAARPAPQLCVGCLSDRWQAEQAKQAGVLPPMMPPLNPALTVVEGNALCRAHLTFGAPAEPQLPGRTRSGLIVDGL